MSLGHETDIPDTDARHAQAAAAGCCLSAVVILTLMALAVCAIERLARRLAASAEPAPYSLCESCGRVLDASHAPCVPESEYGGSMSASARSGGP